MPLAPMTLLRLLLAATPRPTAEAPPPPEDLALEETVVVTASHGEEELLDVPVSVTVIPPERLKTSPARDFADLLRGVPGLNVAKISARDINVTGRGATGVFSQGMLAVVDGMSMNEPNNGLIMWDRFSFALDEIESIEVLHGPGSSVWGADALSGVIQVRTKSPREQPGGSLMLSAGEVGAESASVRWAEAHDVLAWKVSASWLAQDAWERSPKQPDGTPLPSAYLFPGEGTRQPKIDLRADWDLPEGRRWSARAGYSGMSGLIFTEGQPLVFRESSYSAQAGISYESPGLDARLYWHRQSAKTRNAISSMPVDTSNDVLSGEVVARRVVGKRHFLSFGGGMRPVAYDIPVVADDDRFEASAFVEDRISATEKVGIDLGARLDYFDTFGLAVSPRAALILRPRDRLSIRLSASRAFRAPTPVEDALVIDNVSTIDLGLPDPFPFTIAIRGNPALDPQRSVGFELGMTAGLGERNLLTAAVYRKDVRDFVELFPTAYYGPADPPPGWPLDPSLVPPLPKALAYANVGQVIDQGVELKLDSRLGEGWWTSFSATWQDDPDVKDAPGPINLPPSVMASFAGGLLRDRFRSSLALSWQDRAFFTDVAGIAGWTNAFLQVDGSATWSFGKQRHLELTAGATNLLDERIQQHVIGDVIRRQSTLSLRCLF
jgi:outer membrane receptor protein involved in Fe transport